MIDDNNFVYFSNQLFKGELASMSSAYKRWLSVLISIQTSKMHTWYADKLIYSRNEAKKLSKIS